METFPVVIVTMVNEGGFYGYMGTVNSTQTLWKIPLSLETIYDSLKIYTLCSLLMTCILELTRSFVNFHACCRSTNSKVVSNLSVVQSFSYAFDQHRYDGFTGTGLRSLVTWRRGLRINCSNISLETR